MQAVLNEAGEDLIIADWILGKSLTQIMKDQVVADVAKSLRENHELPVFRPSGVTSVRVEGAQEVSDAVIQLMMPHLITEIEKSDVLSHMFCVDRRINLRESGPNQDVFKRNVAEYMHERVAVNPGNVQVPVFESPSAEQEYYDSLNHAYNLVNNTTDEDDNA